MDSEPKELKTLVRQINEMHPRATTGERRVMVLDAWRAMLGKQKWTPRMVAAVERAVQ